MCLWKNWLIGKDPDSGKDWRPEEKGTTEDEVVGWYHRLDGHVFKQALGVGNGQGCLLCCSPWGHKKSHMTELLNWTDPSELRLLCRCPFLLIQQIFVVPLQEFKASQLSLLVKNLPANVGDTRDSGFISGSGRSPEKGNGNLLHYSCLENSMDRGVWRAIVHGATKSQTWLSTHMRV